MIEPKHVLASFQVLELAGIKPEPAIAGNLPAAARVYAAALADLSLADLEAAVLAYVREPLPPGQFWKPWPDTGRLLALVPRRQLAALDDSDVAWAAVKTWCRQVGFGEYVGEGTGRRRGRDPRAGELDADNPGRDAAMREGLAAIGGTIGYRDATEAQEHHTSRRFREAYTAARTRKAVSAEVGAITGGFDVTRLLGDGGDRGGGFRRLGDGSRR